MVLERFEQFLGDNLPIVESFHPHYEKSLSKMLFCGGKRFRPALLLSVVKSYNPLLLDSAMHVAFAIELLHTYSLIHDDLPAMDDAPLRRGVKTLHIEYDETTAILAGDALNTYAFEVLADAPLSNDIKIKLIKSLSHNGGAGAMVLGQAIDCHFEKQPLSIEQIKFLHTHKTAKLIASSLEMGAFIVAKENLAKELYNFGLDLGLLFQIQDDILDVTQSDDEALKTTNNDGDKNSFVTLLGLEEAIKEADELSYKISIKLESFDECLRDELSSILKNYLKRHKENL